MPMRNPFHRSHRKACQLELMEMHCRLGNKHEIEDVASGLSGKNIFFNIVILYFNIITLILLKNN